MEGGGMGERIDYADGRWVVPDHPIIPFIEGDGTGPDIWRAARRVFDAALAKASGKKRRGEVARGLAGGEAGQTHRPLLPPSPLPPNPAPPRATQRARPHPPSG